MSHEPLAPSPHDLTRLDPGKILGTAQVLRARIDERFPGAGLVRVADRLVDVAAHARETCESIARPNLRLRATIGVVIAVLIIALVGGAVAALSSASAGNLSWAELVQVAEAGANDLVLIGAAIYFFVSFETRIKRGRVVKALHGLRTLAHLIDAHQLTKTPELVGAEATHTASSPARALSTFELGRYLDYCTELLALTGKVAALYGDGFDDSESLEAVNEVETLTVGLQGKIWQKLILLRLPSPPPAPTRPPRRPPRLSASTRRCRERRRLARRARRPSRPTPGSSGGARRRPSPGGRG